MMQHANEEEKGGTLGHLEERLQPWNRRRHYPHMIASPTKRTNEGNRSSRGGAKKIRVLVLLLGEDLPHHQ